MTTKNDLTNAQSPLKAMTNRRQALKGFGLGAIGLGAAALLPRVAMAGGSAPTPSSALTDTDILNFALNLEYLEAEFYSYATTGKGIHAQGVALNGQGTQGDVIIKSDPQVPFSDPSVEQYALEIAADELHHVQFLRTALGDAAVAQPKIDLKSSFTAAARAAGIVGPTGTFDPFANDTAFLLGAFIFEDVGVTAYHGAAPLVTNKSYLLAAAGILGTEAYHAATVRTKIYEAGADAIDAAQLISNLRNELGGNGLDQGVTLNGMANIVPTDANGLVFARTVAEVLAIVYFSTTATMGGFFPNGVNSGPTGCGH